MCTYVCVLPLFESQVEGIGGISVYGSNLAIQSLLVALMTYIITISIGKTFARLNQNKYKIDGDQASPRTLAIHRVDFVLRQYTQHMLGNSGPLLVDMT